MTPPSSILTREITVRESILTSRSPASREPTPLQSQVDGLIGGFSDQATDWRVLVSMTAGGMAYRMGRIGVMGLGSGNVIRIASVGAGLTAEVSAFELTNRGLTPLSVGARSPRPQFVSNGTGGETPPLHPNLWRWSGDGGLAQGFLHSFITFGTLKGAAPLARSENFLVQHLLQNTAMVLGHNGSAALGVTTRPGGSLAEQFLNAEATNLQVGAGMALASRMVPGIHALERGLTLSSRTYDPTFLRSSDEGDPRPPDRTIEPSFRLLRPAYALSGLPGELGVPPRPLPEIKLPSLSAMTVEEGRGGGDLGDPLPSRIQNRRDTASPERPFAQEELGLLAELERARWEDRWDLLDRLRTLYVRNMTKKGLEGLQFIRGLYGAINEYIQENRLFHLLLRRNEEGKFYFAPSELQPPFAFRGLKDFPSDPVIYTNRSADSGLGHQAYFAIDRLVLAQDVIDKEKVDEIVSNWGTRPLPPLFVALDSERGFYHLRDGYHRLMAASRLGHSHVRGIVKERMRLSSPPIPLSQIRPVSPEEYARIARERHYGAGQSIGSILLNPKGED